MDNSMRLSTIVSGVLIMVVACNNPGTQTNNVFTKDSLTQHIQVLASDSFMGRRPFTIGEERTVAYMQSSFARLGLEPGNGDSYLQEVPLVDITVHADSNMNVQGPKGSLELKNVTDYVLSTERTDSVISLNNDELVFAGYGVVAPEYNWNDYAGLDVKGKVVLVLVNDPGFHAGDTSLFKGKTMTYYGRWTYKYEEAARQGAKACLIIHNTKGASYPFQVVQTSWGKANLYLDTRGSNEYQLALRGWVSGDAAKRILASAGKDSTLLAQADKPGFKGISLGIKLSTSVKVSAVYNKSKNVIAKITGSKHPDEYIVYTAHWDHLGVGAADAAGDTIYNGAVDNASGSAALLEMARAFKNLNPQPERTVVFLAVTAEEQGLLGSAYYAHNPIYPLNTTVAEFNMDGMSPFEKTKDVVITGMGQSDLEDILVEEAKKQGRYIAPESRPEAGGYFRSDHFNFAKAGVPALNAQGGIDIEGKGKEYGKQLDSLYTARQYHQPSDNFDPNWSFEGCLQDMELLFNVGKRLAFSDPKPQWKEDSEFKNVKR
jgi:Zn-dependent M28 family amino/carboxypeptidase